MSVDITRQEAIARAVLSCGALVGHLLLVLFAEPLLVKWYGFLAGIVFFEWGMRPFTREGR